MTAATRSTDFVSYHIINNQGGLEGRTNTIPMARYLVRRLIEESPSLAPMTIHRAEATAVERHYHGSGEVYHPINPKTRNEMRLDRAGVLS